MNRRDALRKTGLLAGSAVAAPSLFSLLQACSQTPRLNWTPIFLDENQASFLSSFADTLLPKTATPGALDVKSDIFLDLVYAKTYSPEAQAKLKADIDQFNEDCKAKYGKVFSELSKEDKTAFLKEQEANTATFNRGVWGTAVGEQRPVGFYRQLKSQVLWAYFSSKEIGKNVLNYDPIPGEYLGCIPVSEVGKAWSL